MSRFPKDGCDRPDSLTNPGRELHVFCAFAPLEGSAHAADRPVGTTWDAAAASSDVSVLERDLYPRRFLPNNHVGHL